MTDEDRNALIAQMDRVMQLRRVCTFQDRNAHEAAEKAMKARGELVAAEVKLQTILNRAMQPPKELVA